VKELMFSCHLYGKYLLEKCHGMIHGDRKDAREHGLFWKRLDILGSSQSGSGYWAYIELAPLSFSELAFFFFFLAAPVSFTDVGRTWIMTLAQEESPPR
jgi:hypothetical protein